MDTYSENQERHVLIVNSGTRRAYALEAAAYSVGRDSTNAIVLDFETVSRQHALFLRVPNPISKRYEYRIIDGNAEGKPSANGLFINGDRIKSQTLKNGDSIQFGKHVKVAYLTLSMGEAEFVNYLESISYQSLKSELVDSKATMVGMGFDEMFSDTPTVLGNEVPNRPTASTLKPKAKWQQTLHDSDKIAHAAQASDAGNNSEGCSTPQKPIFRLWMAITAIATLVLGGAGAFWIIQESSSKQSVPASASEVQDDAE